MTYNKSHIISLVELELNELTKAFRVLNTKQLSHIKEAIESAFKRQTSIEEVLALISDMDLEVDDLTTKVSDASVGALGAKPTQPSHEGAEERLAEFSKTVSTKADKPKRNKARNLVERYILGDKMMTMHNANSGRTWKSIEETLGLANSAAHYCKTVFKLSNLILKLRELSHTDFDVQKGIPIETQIKMLKVLADPTKEFRKLNVNSDLQVLEHGLDHRIVVNVATRKVKFFTHESYSTYINRSDIK